MPYRFFFVSFLFLFCHLSAIAQFENLVPNPSFEDFEFGCPQDWFEDLPLLWKSWRGTPDVYSTCVVPLNAYDSIGWAPLNGMGFQYPKHGFSYCGFASLPRPPGPFNQNVYREYLGCQLTEPMASGTAYYVSLFVSTAEGGTNQLPTFANSHLGVVFTTQSFDWETNEYPTLNNAQVYSPTIISDTENWTQISATMVADSAYTHMAIGLFFESSLVDYVSINEIISMGSYYFVDDVCVSKNPDCLNTGVEQIARLDHTIQLYPNPADDMVTIQADLQIISICVRDRIGREVLRKSDTCQNVLRLPISGLMQGVYFIEIKTENSLQIEKLTVVR